MDEIELQSRIEELSSTIDFQNGLIEDLRDQITSMKTDLDITTHAWEEDIAKFAEEKESLQNQIDCLAEQLDDAERHRDSERAEVNFLNTELADKDEVIADLEREIVELRGDVRKAYDDLMGHMDCYGHDEEKLHGLIEDAISDLRALPEVPLGELEAAIDAIIDRLKDR